MDISLRADRLAASVCLLALAACSGGGGGGQPSTTASTPTQTGSTTPAQVTIGPSDNASSAASSLSFNFSTNLPPIGTVFTLAGPAVKLTSTSVGASGID